MSEAMSDTIKLYETAHHIVFGTRAHPHRWARGTLTRQAVLDAQADLAEAYPAETARIDRYATRLLQIAKR